MRVALSSTSSFHKFPIFRLFFSKKQNSGLFFFATAAPTLHDLCLCVQALNYKIHTCILAFKTCIFPDRKKDPLAPNTVVCMPQFQYGEAKLKTSNDKQSMAKSALQMKTSLQTGYGKKRYFLLNIGWSIITLHISLLIFSIYMKTITNTQNVLTSCETINVAGLFSKLCRQAKGVNTLVPIRKGL